MADAIVSMLVQQLVYFIYPEIENEVTMFVGVKEDIRNLTRTLKTIHAVLHDAENKQFKEKRVKVWLEDLTEAVYEVEDVLDLWKTIILKSRMKKKSLGSSKDVCPHLFYPCFWIKNSVFSRRSVGQKVKEIRNNLEFIARNKDDYGLISGMKDEISQPRERTSSLVNVSDVYGRDGDRDIILGKIFDESVHHGASVPVISIFGGGGLGKTTLAQYIYRHQRVEEHFQNLFWVCVSHPFDRISIAKAIIVEAGEIIPDNIEWNTLHCLLKKTLEDKVFLLILDDVWTEDFDQWNPFKLCLDGGAAGSQILITTRNKQVAKMVNSVYIHLLKGLNDENSWLLLKFASSIKDETQDYKILEGIGKDIALKCEGVPLSIKTLGSLLRFKKEIHDWNSILKSEMWSMPELVDTQALFYDLPLQYYDLPSSLKPCLMYCATFPKDKKMEKDVLIKLWMAHGFLYSSQCTEFEEIGEKYFNEIVERSLFRDLDRDGSGDIQSCKMHVLFHSFVHFLSNMKTCIIEGDDKTFNNPKLHHLTVCRPDKDISTFSFFDTMKSVRTLNLNNRDGVRGLEKIFRHWTKLRSLDISNTGLQLLPAEIEKLIHLRYLDLSDNNQLLKLPYTLGNLCNLQTLKLNGCSELRKLPASMGKLDELRHLELDSTDKLRSLPKGIEKLRFLRSLSKFVVEKGRQLSDMKNLNLIQRKVEISGLCRVKDRDEAMKANLENKLRIRDLTLNFMTIEFISEDQKERMVFVLEALKPPQHLETFRIRDYPVSKLPSWMNDRSLFLKLRVLNLHFEEQNKCTEVPSLGQLPLLEKLTISNMRSLQRLDLFGISENKDDASNPIVVFPKLSELTISCMKSLQGLDLLRICEDKEDASNPIVAFPKLVKLDLIELENLEWVLPFERSDIIQIMPCLRKLTIKSAYKMKTLPAVWKLESLEELIIKELKSVKRIGPEFFGISEDDVMGTSRTGESLPLVIFPKLEILEMKMLELEEWLMNMPNRREDITFLMPCLELLDLKECQKLKVMPQNIIFNKSVRIELVGCKKKMPQPSSTARLPEIKGYATKHHL